MTIAFDHFEVLKRRVEDLRREKSEKIGARGELLKRAKKELGCSSVKELEILVEKLKKVKDKKGAKYHQKHATVMRRYGKHLKDLK